MRRGFNLCVVPSQDHGVPILEGKGVGKGMEYRVHRGIEVQGAVVNPELMELQGQNY